MIDVVIFDSTTITLARNNPSLVAEIVDLIQKIKSLGIKTAIVATKASDLSSALSIIPHALFDYSTSGSAVLGAAWRTFKGSDLRITSVSRALNTHPERVVYIGDDRYDFYSAINANCFFLYATWGGRSLQAGITVQAIGSPTHAWIFISHVLAHGKRWEYELDAPNYRFSLRCLLSANRGAVSLVADPPHNPFGLYQLLKQQLDIRVGGVTASSLLFWHAIASAKIEGLIPRGAWVTVYPGHAPGRVNNTIQGFMKPASKAMGQFFLADLILRAAPALQSHILASSGGQKTFDIQTDSVHLNPKYQDTIVDKTIVVVDDFHTLGMSLDWARNLMVSAGAKEVVLLTLGKFGQTNINHDVFSPNTGVIIEPFVHKQYGSNAFSYQRLPLIRKPSSLPIIQRSFSQTQLRLPYY